jgi:hypothetical protein
MFSEKQENDEYPRDFETNSKRQGMASEDEPYTNPKYLI